MNGVLEHLGRIADIAIVVGPILWWFVRWSRKLEVTVGLTNQVAKDHLPFVYSRLKVHDGKLGIENPEHPNIGFIPNGVRNRS